MERRKLNANYEEFVESFGVFPHLNAVEIRRASQQRPQLNELLLLLVLFLSYRLKFHAQILDVGSEVSNRLETVLKIAAKKLKLRKVFDPKISSLSHLF